MFIECIIARSKIFRNFVHRNCRASPEVQMTCVTHNPIYNTIDLFPLYDTFISDISLSIPQTDGRWQGPQYFTGMRTFLHY